MGGPAAEDGRPQYTGTFPEQVISATDGAHSPNVWAASVTIPTLPKGDIWPRMETNHLKYFLAILEHRSMSATAKKLGMSQPALSSALQTLERTFGSKLMIRDRSGLILTRTGEELQRCAQDVMNRLAETSARIRLLEKGSEGSFVVGCHESLGAYFMPEFLAGFLKEEPKIEVALWNGTSAAAQQAVLSRAVDFALVVNPQPFAELVIVDLFTDAVDLFVATSPEAQAAAKCPVEEAALLGQALQRLQQGPLIYAARVYQAQELLTQLERQHVLPERRISCGDLEMVKSMAMADLGVAVLPRRVAAYGGHQRLRRLHAGLPHIPDRICLLYRSDLHRTRGALALKNSLTRHGRLLHERGDGFEPPESQGTSPH